MGCRPSFNTLLTKRLAPFVFELCVFLDKAFRFNIGEKIGLKSAKGVGDSLGVCPPDYPRFARTIREATRGISGNVFPTGIWRPPAGKHLAVRQ